MSVRDITVVRMPLSIMAPELAYIILKLVTHRAFASSVMVPLLLNSSLLMAGNFSGMVSIEPFQSIL